MAAGGKARGRVERQGIRGECNRVSGPPQGRNLEGQKADEVQTGARQGGRRQGADSATQPPGTRADGLSAPGNPAA